MVSVVVNGERREAGSGRERCLLWFLRSDLGLTGAKPGCGEGECGACTVLVDGAPVLACQTLLDEVVGRAVTTVEGLSAGGALHPVQQAVIDEAASQCGYCTPAMVLRAAALLEANPHPDHAAVAAAMAVNVCRCGCYPRLERAVRRAGGLTPGERRPSHAALTDQRPRGRPGRPWDLCEPEERDWFDLLDDGLVVVWPPPAEGSGNWSTSGGAWVHVDPSGTITAFTGKVDVGQDNLTAFRLLVAEELGAPLERVQVVSGDTDVCPFDMGTFGSRSMPDAGEALRRAAAGARQCLDGFDRGAVPPGTRRLEVLTDEPPLRQPARWRLAGRPHRAPRLDAVTGTRRFVSDLQRQAMVHGAVLRPPVVGAYLRRFDRSRAERVPGATIVVDGDLVGAVAADPITARAAVAAIEADWELPPAGPADVAAHLRAHPAEDEARERAMDDAIGDADAGLAAAAHCADATYTTAYIAHAPLETRAAMAEWDAGRLTVWTGTQVPFGVRSELAGVLGVAERDVRVIVPPTGGAFGGKHRGVVAIEAARLARAAGRPVMVHWSRGEEFQWGYVRPMAVIDIRAGVDAAGHIEAWDFLNVNAGSAGIVFPYRATNRRLRHQPSSSPLAQAAYRGLAATANAFARESHVDELAQLAGADPFTFRLRNLDDDRLAVVLRAAVDRFGWGAPAAAGYGRGVALGVEKGGRVATCAEVHVEGGTVRVTRIVTVYECGAVVNPETVRNQIEGATVMALGGALFERLALDHGRVAEPSLAAYRVPRFADVPAIEAVLLDRPDIPPAGAGETPLIAVAPAIANALFAATGERRRSLPLLS